MGLPAGWLIVKVKLVVPPMVRSALKALFNVGIPAVTVTVAVLDVTPVAATGPVIETTLVVLFCAPVATPVTVTLITQFAPPANVPPVNARLLPPVTTSEPPQVTVVPSTAVKPVGNASVKAMPAMAVPAFGLVIVNVIVVDPAIVMPGAAKALAIVGGATTLTT